MCSFLGAQTDMPFHDPRFWRSKSLADSFAFRAAGGALLLMAGMAGMAIGVFYSVEISHHDPASDSMAEHLRTLTVQFLLIAPILAVIVVVWARRTAATLSAPIVELGRRADEIAQTGDSALPIAKYGDNEVGRLADSLSDMAHTLQVAGEDRREAEGRYRLLFNSAGEAIIYSRPDGRIEAANPAACRLFGYTQEEFRGLVRSQVLNSSDPRLSAALQTRAQTGRFAGELQFRRKDGTLFPAYLVSTLFVDHRDRGEQFSINIIRDITEQKRIEDELRASSERMKALTSNLLAVQEDARKRLAGSLHDLTSPNLSAIGINLDVVGMALAERNWQEAEARLADTRALIDDTAAGIRDVCADLRPPALDYAGLAPAIQGYAAQFTRRTGVPVAFEHVAGTGRLGQALESALFRIAQEALTNIAKHARASSVVVRLDLAATPITLEISDDGQGFPVDLMYDQPDRHPGLGHLTIRDTTEYFGGRLSIDSSPGHGTRILVQIGSRP
jgi:PAS domain S-box-containing protein